MTWSTNELRARGVSEPMLRFRRWRRHMRLPYREAAAMAGVDCRTLLDAELGRRKPAPRTRRKLAALLLRWSGFSLTPRAETRGAPKGKRLLEAPRRRNATQRLRS